MKKERAVGSKIKFALAAVFVVTVLSTMTLLFVQGVKKQLWEQSVSTIIESTMQGCNTLRIQLEDEYQSMGTVAGNFLRSRRKNCSWRWKAMQRRIRVRLCICLTAGFYRQGRGRMKKPKSSFGKPIRRMGL